MQMKNIQIGNGGLLVQKAEIGNCLHGDIEANKSQFVGLLKNPLGTKGRISILSCRKYQCVQSSQQAVGAELHSLSAEENRLTSNAASPRSVKTAAPPCAAKAAIRRGHFL